MYVMLVLFFWIVVRFFDVLYVKVFKLINCRLKCYDKNVCLNDIGRDMCVCDVFFFCLIWFVCMYIFVSCKDCILVYG